MKFVLGKIITCPHQNSTHETEWNSETFCTIKVRPYVGVVINNDPLSAGVAQLHSRLRLSCNWVTSASLGSLSNIVLAIIYITVALSR